MIIEMPYYVIKQSNNTIFIFTYNTNNEIICNIKNDEIHNNPFYIIKDARKNFSVMLLPDDKIYILYQNIIGHLMISVYDKLHWTSVSFFENKNKNAPDVNFKAAYFNSKINIFYSIQSSKENTVNLLHQEVEEDFTKNTPALIDSTTKENFKLHISNNKIFIIYEKYNNNYFIGYKVLETSTSTWSNFKIINQNIMQFQDYSLIYQNGEVHALYIKNKEDRNTLYHSHGLENAFKHKKIYAHKNIEVCNLYNLKNKFFICWIIDNTMSSTYSNNNGKSFYIPPKFTNINLGTIVKVIYETNVLQEQYLSKLSEIYLLDEQEISSIFEINILEDNNNIEMISSEEETFSVNSTIIENSKQVEYYKQELYSKDQLIIQLKHIIQEEKRKSNSINNTNTNLKIENENLNIIKESLDKKVNKSQDILISKDLTITELEKEILGDKENIISLNNKIVSLELEIKELTEEISRLETQLNSSFFSKIFSK
jgi:hypothetical protein